MSVKPAGEVTIGESVTLEGETFQVFKIQWVPGRGVRFFKTGDVPFLIVPFREGVRVN